MMTLRLVPPLIGLVAMAGCGEAPERTRNAATVAAAPARPDPAPAPAAPEATPALVGRDGQNFRLAGRGTELRIEGSETNYDIILPTDLLFDFDRAELRPEAQPLLRKAKAHLDEHGSDQLHVKGHTDAKGDDQYNFRLSMRRAAAVCDWLKAQGETFTNCIGRGEQEPAAPNEKPDGADDPLGRQQNRRVTISVVKYPDVNAMLSRARRSAEDARATLNRP